MGEKLDIMLIYSAIEWSPKDLVSLDKEHMLKIQNMLEILHDNDDIQNVIKIILRIPKK